MKKKIFSILSKAPMPEGRIGSSESQDCHVSCLILADELMRDDEALALIVTNLELDGMSEMSYYDSKLRSFGIPGERIVRVHEGLETMHQLVRSAEEARRHDRELVIVLVAVHLIRTKFLCYVLGIKATFIVAHGIPRPKDVLSEMLLIPTYPLFLSRHFRAWFQNLANKRRLKGKL